MSTDLETLPLFNLEEVAPTRPEVKRVPSQATHDLILTKHYAQRLPSISHAFGYFEHGQMIGALTIGKPASHQLCVGLAGPHWSSNVYELNRLIVDGYTHPNALSFFVGKAMKLLANTDIVLVSYADESMGHHGYIYQATNWVYTGKTKSRTDKYTPSGKHSRHYTDEYPHLRKVRSSKHRYVYVPNRRLRKRFFRDMNYPIVDYPKGNNERYRLGEAIKTKVINTLTGEVHYE